MSAGVRVFLPPHPGHGTPSVRPRRTPLVPVANAPLHLAHPVARGDLRPARPVSAGSFNLSSYFAFHAVARAVRCGRSTCVRSIGMRWTSHHRSWPEIESILRGYLQTIRRRWTRIAGSASGGCANARITYTAADVRAAIPRLVDAGELDERRRPDRECIYARSGSSLHNR